MKQLEKWGVFETVVNGRSEGNPFLDYDITGRFTGEHETVKVGGFYDGDGVYRVRFMPSFEGKYTYTITSAGIRRGVTRVALPGKQYMAIRIKSIK